MKCIILDHHEILGINKHLNEFKYHINPHLFSYNGSFEISGSGLAYVLASLFSTNDKLIPLAIVGSIGDMQNRKYCKLVGLNREILEIGINKNLIIAIKDLSLFGKQTRKLHKIFQYSTDPYIPQLSGNENYCINFIKNICNSYDKNSNIYWFSLKLE